MECMCVCPSFSYLKAANDLNHCINVYWLLPSRFEAVFKRGFALHNVGWVEKSGMLDAMPLVNLNDTCHLEHLAVYDGALCVGNHSELPGNANGASCCQTSSNTSKRATMKQHIARPIPWHHGTASRELKLFVKNIDKMPHVEDTMMDVELGNRDRGAAPGVILRCQAKRGGPDTPAVPHQTHCC